MLVVAGASGRLGRSVAEQLLTRVEPDQILLLSRTPDRLAEFRSRGTQVRFADFDDPASLTTALTGGRRMLLISTDVLDRRVAQHRAAIEAAAQADIDHVIYTSLVSPDPSNPAIVAESHRQTEADLLSSGLEWSLLRNNLYAEYQATEADQAAASGRLIHNRGQGRAAYVSRLDCAAAAAAVLAGEGHAGRVYDITGPESLSDRDLARIYAKLAGRPVEPVAIDDEQFVAAMSGGSSDGHLAYGAQLVASFGRAIREGHFAQVSDSVELLTGRAPRSLYDVLAARA